MFQKLDPFLSPRMEDDLISDVFMSCKWVLEVLKLIAKLKPLWLLEY
jgi:hypothetical protein